MDGCIKALGKSELQSAKKGPNSVVATMHGGEL